MVFLGGAVLANIVRFPPSLTIFPSRAVLPSADTDSTADGRQREHVDLEAGMAGAGAQDTGKTRSKMR